MLSSRVLASLAAAMALGTADGATTPVKATPLKDATTCGALKKFYKDSSCCGSPTTAVKLHDCPYNFNKPLCENAEVQAPRDLSTGAAGLRTPKQATLNKAQAAKLPLANVHYHLGAEHKSDAYKDDTDAKAYDAAKARRLDLGIEEAEDDDDDEAEELGIAGPRRDLRRLATGAVRPGFMCPAAPAAEKDAYTFQYCKNVEVGKTYEIHYVHSSAGTFSDKPAADSINDGLGAAAHGRKQLNPMVVVQGLVVQVVNKKADATFGKVDDLFNKGWSSITHTNAVMYPGSTTGPSHDNKVCSPYAITWHVDKDCHKVSAASFDNMCKIMSETHKMTADLPPHGSRIILDSKWVAPAEYVKTLA